MKLIIASDIHGSLKYIKKLEELIKKEKPEKLIILGDIYYHGPRNPLPEEYNCNEVSKILNKYQDIIIGVQGNCDAEVDQMISEFKINSEDQIIKVNNYSFYLTHGHHLKELNIKDDIIYLVGHTHIYNLEGNIINPGSVGLPKENKEHTCILFDNNVFYLIDLDNLNTISKRNINE